MGYEKRKKHHAQRVSEKQTCSIHIEKKEEDSPCRKEKRNKERDRIMQKGVPINLMVKTSIHSGPSVHLTISTISIHVHILI
jgi:hypothetical protein